MNVPYSIRAEGQCAKCKQPIREGVVYQKTYYCAKCAKKVVPKK